MRYWKNICLEGAALVLTCTVLGACHASADARPRLTVASAQIERSVGEVWLRTGIDLRPSSVQMDALQHGVPLVLRLRVEGSRAATPAAQMVLTLRYFPLTRRYQLRIRPGEDDRSFALRGYLFDALTRLRVRLPHDPCAAAADCRLQVRFDYAALPGALRLPALLQPAWRMSPVSVAVAAP